MGISSGLRQRAVGRTGPNLSGLLLRLLLLLILDLGTIWFVANLVHEGLWFVASAVSVVVVGLNVIFLTPRTVGLRWLSPGLALLCLLVIAPIIYTVYVAFTNYNNDHVLTERQAVRVFERETYLDEGAETFGWTAFRTPSGEYALWLQSEGGEPMLVRPGEPPQTVEPGSEGIGPLDENGVAESVEGYRRLSRAESVAVIGDLSNMEFGEGADAVKVKSLDEAAQYKPKYVYDEDTRTLTDQSTGKEYTPIQGTFTSADGQKLRPAFFTIIGWKHFHDTFTRKAYVRPMASIFVWTITYAAIVVVVQFAIGLLFAVAFQELPRHLAKAIRSILLLPFVVPAYLSVLVWKQMFNPHLGILTHILHSAFGVPTDWTLSPTGAKLLALIVTFWLGFPYFLLINTGALHAIPNDVIEAGTVDGANAWQRFWRITFPLVMQIVGPLIVLAWAFNFNNFTVIYLLTEGGPAMANVQTPAGHTDLLISYVYKLAFTFSNAEYGLASVISILIFFILAPVVISQFRTYQVWKEE